ncbi:MAG: hypothetical protein AAF585_12790 [Verrucomicrobiota bacterium]
MGTTLQSSKKRTTPLEEANRRVRMLENELNQLKLATEALWEIVRDGRGYNNDVLTNRMNELRFAQPIHKQGASNDAMTTCSECGHPVPLKRPNCVYCGAKVAA